MLRGGGSYKDENGVETDVNPGDAIIVLPGLEHWYGPPKGEVWDELYLVFEGPVFDLWREEGCFDDTPPVVSLHPSDYWLDHIKQAIGDSNEGNPHKMMAEAVRLQNLLTEIQHAARADIEVDIAWLEDAKNAIKLNENVRDAAAETGVDYEVFRKKFRRLAGMPPGKFRTAILMERACNMLSERDVTLQAIAGELGYCDEYHFSKQFSKTIGWSPREYRARITRR